MKLIIMDTETSDIRDAEIGQLTYFLLDDDYTVHSFNEWFALDYVSDGASAVNGLTVEKLKDLSKGQVFSDVAERVYNDFKDAIVVCHNVGFDLPLVNRSVMDALGKPLDICKSFCTMEYYTPILQLSGPYGYKWPRLNEVTDYLGINEEQIALTATKLFQSAGIGFHDARFDVAATYSILREIANSLKGYKVTSIKTFIDVINQLC